jgi:hypothetical protein
MSERIPPEIASPPPLPEASFRWALRNLEEALRGLRFGIVTLLVQDGVVVQVERTERHRYQRPPLGRESTV